MLSGPVTQSDATAAPEDPAQQGLLLLGQPALDPDSLPLPPEVPLWLTAFVTCHQEPVSRLEVLDLLYPDVPAATARNRLRQLLHRMRRFGWAAGLSTSGDVLRWTGRVDVRLFRQACLSGRALGRGDRTVPGSAAGRSAAQRISRLWSLAGSGT